MALYQPLYHLEGLSRGQTAGDDSCGSCRYDVRYAGREAGRNDQGRKEIDKTKAEAKSEVLPW